MRYGEKIIAATMGLSLCTVAVFAAPQSDLSVLAQGNSTFAFDLYHRLLSTQGNLFFSPYSVSTALAMTYAGARGNTEKEMAGTLCFSLNQEKLHPAFLDLQTQVISAQKSGGVKLFIANSLWPDRTYKFLDSYISLVSRFYGVSITPVDYVKAAEAARELINNWVEEKTQGKIKEIIPPRFLNHLTRLVLVNAIYFKGNWESQFKKSETKIEPFRVTPGTIVNTPMMAQVQKARYAELKTFQMLELPYSGKSLSMLVLLPKEEVGVGKLESSLSAEALVEWKKHLSERDVQVFLPKFKMVCGFRMDKTLKSLGMIEAFDDNANFAGMDGTRLLYIGAVLHKAFVELNEEGTEAAAATAVIVALRSMPSPQPVFRADHPFVFLIQENQTGSILFMGRLNNPAQTGE